MQRSATLQYNYCTVTDVESQSALSAACSEAQGIVHKAKAFLRREIELGLEMVPARVGADSARSPVMAAEGKQGKAVCTAASVASEQRPLVAELSGVLVEEPIRVATDLEALRDVLADCQRCKLCSGRTNIVFGVGNPSAELMFVGEGPGQDEDIQGLPFVGRAGRLLTDIIEKGMGLARDEVYIANVVKCRPPNNRNPEPDEIVACEPFLHRQIALVRPRVVVTLGAFATQVLLRDRTAISKQRGRWHDYQGVPVMPTFHPAYLLRNGGDKRLVWDDIKMVMERLGIPVP